MWLWASWNESFGLSVQVPGSNNGMALLLNPNAVLNLKLRGWEPSGQVPLTMTGSTSISTCYDWQYKVPLHVVSRPAHRWG